MSVARTVRDIEYQFIEAMEKRGFDYCCELTIKFSYGRLLELSVGRLVAELRYLAELLGTHKPLKLAARYNFEFDWRVAFAKGVLEDLDAGISSLSRSGHIINCRQTPLLAARNLKTPEVESVLATNTSTPSSPNIRLSIETDPVTAFLIANAVSRAEQVNAHREFNLGIVQRSAKRPMVRTKKSTGSHSTRFSFATS